MATKKWGDLHRNQFFLPGSKPGWSQPAPRKIDPRLAGSKSRSTFQNLGGSKADLPSCSDPNRWCFFWIEPKPEKVGGKL